MIEEGCKKKDIDSLYLTSLFPFLASKIYEAQI